LRKFETFRIILGMWTKIENGFLEDLRTPWGIQLFLNSIPYNKEEDCKSPRRVIRDRSAHCAEGAYFAAAALEALGHRPLVVDLLADNDDDHLLAVFREDGLWGAVAKSNTTVLRFREPVYRSLRELVMSYFDFYFNTLGEKTLVAFSRPVDLSRFDSRSWRTTEEDLDFIGEWLNRRHHAEIVPRDEGRRFFPVDPDLLEACFLKANPEGLFKPEER